MKTNIIQHVTKTIYGSELQTARVLLRPLNVREFTTINEAISDSIKVPYQPKVSTQGLQEFESFDPVNDSPKISIGYVVIGNGGHNTSITANETSFQTPRVHQATDAAPFKMIPFICKPAAADISDEERRNYRLRKILIIDGEPYVAYYAKVLDFSNSEVNTIISRTINGETIYTPFVPTINNLRPIPVPPGVEDDGTKIFASATTTFEFTEKDVEYLTEASINMFGSPHEAIISEIGFCSGLDKKIVRAYPLEGSQTTDSTIASRNLVEAAAVQVTCFVNTYFQASFGMGGFSITFDVGAIEPLFGKTNG